jgi:hypothetical protein
MSILFSFSMPKNAPTFIATYFPGAAVLFWPFCTIPSHARLPDAPFRIIRIRRRRARAGCTFVSTKLNRVNAGASQEPTVRWPGRPVMMADQALGQRTWIRSATYFPSFKESNPHSAGVRSAVVEGIGRPRVAASFIPTVIDCMMSDPGCGPRWRRVYGACATHPDGIAVWNREMPLQGSIFDI